MKMFEQKWEISPSEWKKVQDRYKRLSEQNNNLQEAINSLYDDLEAEREKSSYLELDLFTTDEQVKSLKKQLKTEKSTNTALLEKLNELLNTMETFGLANRKFTITSEDL